MDEYNTERLGDQPSEAAIQIPEATTIGDAIDSVGTDQWLVILDEAARPEAAVHSTTLLDYPAERPLSSILSDLKPMVLARADVPLNSLHPWFEELEQGSAVVVEHADHFRVWAGPDLRQIILGGSESLPGIPHTPLHLRACRYLMSCGHPQQFQTKPRIMPTCKDPKGLGLHQFEW
ncbi:hypothetical protein AB0L26_26045 [Streptomyces nondiastaticus]|uniref:hypothetical protein n=1 Tax=Streptomyces nondiastaticus TaxID=3154512 RepID=UPI0034498AB0